MISKVLKLGLSTTFCLASAQAFAQNVTAGSATTLNPAMSQVETNASSSIQEAFGKFPKHWEKSVFTGQDRSKSLSMIYERTAAFLKSPNRVQRVGQMGGMEDQTSLAS